MLSPTFLTALVLAAVSFVTIHVVLVSGEDDGSQQQSSRFEVERSWSGGMTAETCIDHNLDIDCGWEMQLTFSTPIIDFQIWDAEATDDIPSDGTHNLTLASKHWTSDEPSGTCHRFNAFFNEDEPPTAMARYTRICAGGNWEDLVNGQRVTLPPPPEFQMPGREDYLVNIDSSWKTGITGEICLFHTQDITCGFDAEIIVSLPYKQFRIWTMTVVDKIKIKKRKRRLMRFMLTNTEGTMVQPNNPQCHRFLIKHKPNKKPAIIRGRYTRSCHNGEINTDPNAGGTVPPPTTTTTATTQKSTTRQPTTQQPTTQQQTTQQPTTQQPTTQQPTTQQPRTQQPTTQQPTTQQPTTQQPTTQQQTTQQPTTQKPTTQQPTTQQPRTQQPTTQQPTTQQPTTQQPTTQQPTTQQPTTQQPITQQPTTQQPTTQHQTTQQPTSRPSTSSTPVYVPAEPAFDYGTALNMSMQFYFAQRSGPIDDTVVPWRTEDSAMNDGSDVGTDLVGGWYDAGDYVKFGFPMAASATNLLWGMIQYQDAYSATGELEMMYKMMRHPLEYFLKCWDETSEVFYGQVGNGDSDHSQWGRPEDISIDRPAYSLDANSGGSDLAAETAAALAAGFMAFSPHDPGFANDLLRAAVSLYSFADKYKRPYHESIPDAAKFYRSHNGYEDELCWGAAWLFAATGDASFKRAALSAMNRMNQNPQEFSWDSKEIGCYVMMMKYGDLSSKSAYAAKVSQFMNRWVSFNGGIRETPCGLAWLREWGSLRYSANTALIALMAADEGVNPGPYRAWAERQIKFMLGANTNDISYLIGYGNVSPRNPHHRAASCPPAPESCTWTNYGSSDPNPHQLTGALVGGPDAQGNYQDKRNDHVKNEVATDYNAGFQSVLAGLISLTLDGNLPQASTQC